MKTNTEQIDEGISLKDALLFVKASRIWIALSTLFFLSAFGFHYINTVAVNHASASITLPTIAGELVEPLPTTFEKIKLPTYFQLETHKSCGIEGPINSNNNLFKKVKVSVNKLAPIIAVEVQSVSKEGALNCLQAVVSGIDKAQSPIFEILISHKKQKMNSLKQELVAAENLLKSFPLINAINQFSDQAVSGKFLRLSSLNSVNNLNYQISLLEAQLENPLTKGVEYAVPLITYEVQSKIKPYLIFLCSLGLGLFFGVLLTWLIRKATNIKKLLDPPVS